MANENILPNGTKVIYRQFGFGNTVKFQSEAEIIGHGYETLGNDVPGGILVYDVKLTDSLYEGRTKWGWYYQVEEIK